MRVTLLVLYAEVDIIAQCHAHPHSGQSLEGRYGGSNPLLGTKVNSTSLYGHSQKGGGGTKS